ncbi:MAG: hypothetical protein AB4058_03455 [Microcystaceae cyanobacterium]
MIDIYQAATIALEATTNLNRWESIVINKRKPYTYRAFMMYKETRICLHRFEACEAHESFAHPHPWPSSMLILEGDYDMDLFFTSDLKSSELLPVINVSLSSGSIYHIKEQKTWHKVIPRTICYSLMINGSRWSYPHRYAPTTKGKGLKPMAETVLQDHLSKCQQLIKRQLVSWAEF